ncbi:MAG: hypothetical protein ABIQ55_11775 [Gemmatimonadaceae bacterium]
MFRRLIQIHTTLVGVASLALLIVPGPFLAGLGVTEASFGILSLTRVIAVLLMIVAAAVSLLSRLDLPGGVIAARTIGGTYMVAAVLLLGQEIAIWNTTGGGIIVAAAAIAGIVFLAASVSAPRVREVAAT